MIYINNICLDFGSRKLFDTISLSLDAQSRIGLIGRNGSGKSTLLKAIAKQQQLDSGTIAIAKGKKVAYMPQEVVLLSDKSILEETFSAFKEIATLREQANKLEQQINQNPHDENALEQFSDAIQRLAELHEDQARAETKKVLMGLGFPELRFNEPVDNLSVGWKMRVVLAKLLLQKADFYLFDEPTNHLDIVAKDWFINFLKKARCGFILVCHERYFIDQLCTKIFELELGNGKLYEGNYSQYEQRKKHDVHLLEQAYAQQQKDIKRKTKTIERFRASASKAKMAQSMAKQLDKMEKVTLPPSLKNVIVSFPPIQKSGRIVLTVKDVAHSFGPDRLFHNVNFQIERGEKVALVAPNGVGKTTLFNLIVGNIPVQEGSIEFGYNVNHAIFAQDQNKVLDLERTILDNIHDRTTNKTVSQIRGFLGSFLFTGDDVKKKVQILSGGEKNRVAMVNVLLQDANLLLLDEPTNHLDIQSKEILLSALQQHNGTILFVSHDHDFINRLATRVIELTPEDTQSYLGNYELFLYQKQQRARSSADVPHQSGITQPSGHTKHPGQNKSQKELFELRKQSKKLENKIAKLEKEIAALELKFADLTYNTKEYDTNHELLLKYKKELGKCFEKWHNLEENINI